MALSRLPKFEHNSVTTEEHQPAQPNANHGRRQWDRLFRTDHLKNDLGKRSVRGAAATTFGQGSQFVINLAATAVLARLLAPEDFGLVAMTTVVQAFFMTFREAGLATATIQSDDVTHEQVSTLFWINLGLGAILAVILVALSPAVAWFFGEPRLTAVMCAMSLTFILGGFTVQHQALLRRQMRFSAVATVNVCGLVVGVATGIVMAVADFGYWSLVGMNIGNAAATAAGIWFTTRWLPGRPHSFKSVAHLLKFGADVLMFASVNFFSRRLDTVLIGWYWGPVALAFYTKAYQLLLLPIRQINLPLGAVVVPSLSRLRNDGDALRHQFVSALQLAGCITIPIVVGSALFADQAVAVLLGPSWSKSAELFRLLCPAALAGALINPLGWLLLSTENSKRYRQLGLLSAIVVVGSFVVGLRNGIESVAVCYSIATVLMLVPSWWYATRNTPVGLFDIFRALAPTFVSCLPAVTTAAFILRLRNDVEIDWIIDTSAVVSFAFVYSTTLLIGFRQWRGLKTILGHLKPSSKKTAFSETDSPMDDVDGDVGPGLTSPVKTN